MSLGRRVIFGSLSSVIPARSGWGKEEQCLSKTANDTFPWFLFLFYVKHNFEIFCGYIYHTVIIQDDFT